jgi:hypothetical protein
VVLSLSANTSFADFPRLCRAVAENGYLPYPFAFRGRRLVFSYGIYALVIIAGCLLIIFRGITDRLIPLFAVGAFLAFTLSQAGMVMHWKRVGGSHAPSMLINGIGALATGAVTCIVLVTKFTQGAWITALLVISLILLMASIHRHYEHIYNETRELAPASLAGIKSPFVVLPMDGWSHVSEKALRFAYAISQDICVIHIDTEQELKPENSDLKAVWGEYIESPAKRAGLKPPELVILHSPYRMVVTPIFEYVLQVEREHPDRDVAVLVPELVERRWYQYLLHGHRATALKLILYRKGNRRTVVINVPWYLSS